MEENQPTPSFPPFSELPLDPSGPPGNAWGRFGDSDRIGMLNLLTPSVVTAAAQEIKTGIRVSLDWPLNKPKYPSYGRPGIKHEILNRQRGPSLRVVNDDFLSFNTQSSTQWDGFRHLRYYNNTTHDDVASSGALGIDAWAESGGIVGRGLLLDYASWAVEKSIKLNPFSATQIPLSQLQELIQERQITFRPGDILFIRVGFTAAYDALTEEGQVALSERPTANFSGVESSEATLRFLWDNQFAAVAGDAPSFERSPPVGPHADDRFVLHEWLLAGWGMPIGEMFDLERLSETCRKLGRNSFFVSSMPLKVPGGVASPLNAVAIF
ncbi:hypothetical protein GQ43DRAFT_454883 [Delitschia confertaspora ATCC 74209]|uniref:Cyclase n=1 Tax=Delitschia confertaspora ATCC 74209 TaxID=1513339 RepID=A0A9P4JPF9_9PLEO|nr:hypothetical protein GQ43DRAFT_454883 [Delitschia confertaspora ATCC 74209]